MIDETSGRKGSYKTLIVRLPGVGVASSILYEYMIHLHA
jgi:hypothetical protein